MRAGAIVLLLGALAMSPTFAESPADLAIRDLVAKHGEALRPRIERGVRQVAERWWEEDGSPEAMRAFCVESFLADPAALDAAADRLEYVLEQTYGRLHEISRELQTPEQLDTGPVSPLDARLSDVDLASHVQDDLFRTKAAFVALLNFPVHTLAERLKDGPGWDRKTWARSRLMDAFAVRVPASVSQEATVAFNDASRYVDAYDIRMDRIACADGKRPFREGLRLISHWGLRDELKSWYGKGPEGLERQRIIAKVMDRIVRQEIPKIVIGNPDVVWCPETNEVRDLSGKVVAAPREPDTRYGKIVSVFRAVRKADPFVPTAPTYIARRFELDRQIPEAEVEKLLVSVLDSEEVTLLAKEIGRRLGRPLEPFDIWYNGLSARAGQDEAKLDALTKEKYPTVAAFQADVPNVLTGLGFSPERAAWVAARIVVDPSRGAGHAMGAVRRGDLAHLRTRIPSGGMLYKGYNIAIHELGHNVEQVFSLDGIDHWALSGVPNNGFTEALAFVFQERDLELLGLGKPSAEARRKAALDDLWSTYEIGGVALVDMRVWRWLYAHPDAGPAELREATLGIAREVWNRWYAPRFGVKDSEILAIYSHMVSYALYLPDYPLGHLIAFQVARKLREEDFGKGFERMARQGRLTPDLWMRGAVGAPLSSEALLREAREALSPSRGR